MRRVSLALLAMVAVATAGLAGVASASTSYPFEADTYGVDTNAAAALPGASSLSIDGGGLINVAGSSDVWRLAPGGEIVQHRVPVAPVASMVQDQPDRLAFELNQPAISPTDDDYALHVLAPDGTLIRADKLGTGSNLNDPIKPTAMAADPSSPFWGAPVVYVYGLDSSNQPMVEVVDPQISDTGSADFLLGSFPVRLGTDLVVAPDHTLYVIDSGGTVSHYTEQGVFVGGTQLKVPGESQNVGVAGATVDGAGHLFVTQANPNRVVEFALDGTFIQTFGDNPPLTWSSGQPLSPGSLSGPSGISVDCRGRLWILDKDNTSRLSRLVSYTGVATGAGTCSGPAPRVVNTSLSGAYLLATDRAGNVFAASYGMIRKIDRTGKLLATWGNAQATNTGPSAIGIPTGLAVTPGGDVLVSMHNFCDAWNADGCTHASTTAVPRVIEFHSTGTWVRTLTGPVGGTAWTFPYAVSVRKSDGAVFVANNASPTTTVQQMTSAFALARSMPVAPLTGSPTNSVPSVKTIAFDPAGDVVASVLQPRVGATPTTPLFDYTTTNVFNSQIQRWDTNGTALASWSAPQPAPADTPTPSANNAGDDEALSMVVLPNGSSIWSSVTPMLYPHRATNSLLTVGANGVPTGIARDMLGYDDAARLGLDCTGDLLVIDSGTLRALPVTAPTSCIWKPTATTGTVASRTTTSLKVHGYASPSGQVTRIRVLYGLTTSYGKATSWITLPSDNVTLARYFTLSGLLTKHSYHYRVQVTNGSGTVKGVDRVGTTE